MRHLIALAVLSACQPVADSDSTDSDAADPADTGPAPVYAVVFMHSEDPNHPETADYLHPASWDTWVAGRRVLVRFAERLAENGVVWDFQPDWNLTKATVEREIDRRAPSGHTPAEIDALVDETAGKNLYRYLAEDLGVAIDPHSHEGSAFGDPVEYNYADVAMLIDETGVTPTGIVGGHVMSGDNFQDWPRFKAPVPANHDATYTWTARALMGGGTASHVNEQLGAGIWRPTEPGASEEWDNYWVDDPNSSLPAIGNWRADQLDPLLAQREEASEQGSILVATAVVNHSALIVAACGDIDADDRIADLDACDYDAAVDAEWDATIAPLVAHQATGAVELLTFDALIDVWASDFGSQPSLCLGDGEACERAF